MSFPGKNAQLVRHSGQSMMVLAKLLPQSLDALQLLMDGLESTLCP